MENKIKLSRYKCAVCAYSIFIEQGSVIPLSQMKCRDCGVQRTHTYEGDYYAERIK